MISELRFKEDFRIFKSGTSIPFRDPLTIIVGDNGAGKSSLVSLLRSRFVSEETLSMLPGDVSGVFELSPEPAAGTRLNYIDLAKDHFAVRPEMSSANFDEHLRALHQSSGQGSFMQVVNLIQKSDAKVHILDEPERGLSPAKIIVLAEVLKELMAERPDHQFIIITHDSEVMKLSEEVLVLPQGIYLSPMEYRIRATLFGQDVAERWLTLHREEKGQGREISL